MNQQQQLSFFEKLEARVENINSLLCVGLDPHINELKGNTTAEGCFEFCKKIICNFLKLTLMYSYN